MLVIIPHQIKTPPWHSEEVFLPHHYHYTSSFTYYITLYITPSLTTLTTLIFTIIPSYKINLIPNSLFTTNASFIAILSSPPLSQHPILHSTTLYLSIISQNLIPLYQHHIPNIPYFYVYSISYFLLCYLLTFL
jgi:hypothetical protein